MARSLLIVSHSGLFVVAVAVERGRGEDNVQAQGIRQNPVINYSEERTTGSPEELSSSLAGRFGDLLTQMMGGGAGWTPDLAALMATSAVQAPVEKVEAQPEPQVETEKDSEEKADVAPNDGNSTNEDAARAATAAPVTKKTVEAQQDEPKVDEVIEAEAEAAPSFDTYEPAAASHLQMAAHRDATVAEQSKLPQAHASMLDQDAQLAADKARQTVTTTAAPTSAQPTDVQSQQIQAAATAEAKPVEAVKVREQAVARTQPAAEQAPVAETAAEDSDSMLFDFDQSASNPKTSLTAKFQGAFAEGAEQMHRSNGGDRKLSFGEYDAKFGGARGSSPVQNAEQSAAGQNAHATAEKSVAGKMKGGAPNLTPEDRVKMLQEMKELLKKAALSRDGNTLTLKVEPQELGQVNVKIQHRDGAILARITSESAEVEQLLRDNAQEMSQVLAAAGMKTEQVHVSIGRERVHSESFRFSGQQQFENQRSNEGGSGNGNGREERTQNGTQGLGAETATQSSSSASLAADSGWIA